MQPNPAKAQLVRAWLIKALHDLLAAEQLSNSPELLDMAVYHCQQAAEKALKGFLVWVDTPPPRTHELAELVLACASAEIAFNTLDHAARLLSPYAVQFRYPDAVLDPTDADTRDAIRLAWSIYQFVQGYVPDGSRP